MHAEAQSPLRDNQTKRRNMNQQRNIRRTLLAVVLSAFGAGTMAQEIEDNNNINKANPLTVGSTGSVTVTGYIGRAGSTTRIADIDFFSFEAREGDNVIIDIDA